MEHYEAFFILPEAESGNTWEVLYIGGPSIAGVVSVSAQQSDRADEAKGVAMEEERNVFWCDGGVGELRHAREWRK